MRHFKYLVVILSFLSFCFAESANGQQKAFVATIDKDGVQRVEVLAGEYFFDPDYIVLKVNVPVEIEIKKEPGMVPHNITIKAPEAGIEFSESLRTKPTIIRFTPLKTGKYAFYCKKKLLFFKSHREKGMEGVLEVRP